MVLKDIETEKNIVNPYITIYSPYNPKEIGVNLNTSNFYEKGIKLRKFDEKAYKRFPCLKKRGLYRIVSVTGKPHLEDNLEEGGNFIDGVEKCDEKEKLEKELGFITEKEVMKFPNAYEFLSKSCKKRQPRGFRKKYDCFIKWYERHKEKKKINKKSNETK
jgi:predicted RNA-binding protein with RPS1 domain